ncbi:MAG: hypothetical protein EBS01_12125 [Verrucomicrobia bacterium]|nr:hypothetical protein [Verrucomicrobiota bacterium]
MSFGGEQVAVGLELEDRQSVSYFGGDEIQPLLPVQKIIRIRLEQCKVGFVVDANDGCRLFAFAIGRLPRPPEKFPRWTGQSAALAPLRSPLHKWKAWMPNRGLQWSVSKAQRAEKGGASWRKLADGRV